MFPDDTCLDIELDISLHTEPQNESFNRTQVAASIDLENSNDENTKNLSDDTKESLIKTNINDLKSDTSQQIDLMEIDSNSTELSPCKEEIKPGEIILGDDEDETCDTLPDLKCSFIVNVGKKRKSVEVVHYTEHSEDNLNNSTVDNAKKFKKNDECENDENDEKDLEICPIEMNDYGDDQDQIIGMDTH